MRERVIVEEDCVYEYVELEVRIEFCNVDAYGGLRPRKLILKVVFQSRGT